MREALRINFGQGFSVEAVPTQATYNLPKAEVYAMVVTSDATSFTSRRDHIQDELFLLPKDYVGLRKFYTQFERRTRRAWC